MSKSRRIYILLSTVAMVAALAVFLIMPGCNMREERRTKNYVIGYVNPNPEEEEGAQAFLRYMLKLGFVEGKNVTYIKHESSRGMEAAVKEMVGKHVDLIFVMTQPAATVAKQVTEGTKIPVVFVLYDAVGLVNSLAKPGGNLTGVQLAGSTPKSFEFLLKIKPETRHIVVPVKFDTGAARSSLEDFTQSASKLGIKVTVYTVGTVEQLRSSMSSMPEDTDVVFVLHSWLVGEKVDMVIDEAIKRKIPVFSAGHVDASKGVVLSYAPDSDRTGEKAARLADSILRGGISPADLPVQTADFFLGINLKTARAAGIEIPHNMLQQADFIVRK